MWQTGKAFVQFSEHENHMNTRWKIKTSGEKDAEKQT